MKSTDEKIKLIDDNLFQTETDLIPLCFQQVVPIFAGARFIFTARDRTLSTPEKPVFKRVDCIRGAWGGLFVAAGLAEPKESRSGSTAKYKSGIKTRKDFSVPYTRHDMRRAFNVAAKRAGMSMDDRCTILGHGVNVNREHYNGKPELDVERVSEFLEKMKLEGVG